MGWLTDLIHGEVPPVKYSNYNPEHYTEQPNRSLFTGDYSQPFFFGPDSIHLGGKSPDYPKYRSYADYFFTEFPMPTKDQFTYIDVDGEEVFMREEYNAAMKEWHKQYPIF